MSKIPYTQPGFEETSFNCPSCQAYASQNWFDAYYDARYSAIAGLKASYCSHCGVYSVWRNGKMISPTIVVVAPPNADLDEDVRNDYREASEILSRSPRSAAALLRLALQKMCNGQLAAVGGDLNAQIKDLVAKGLSPLIQQSLDALRVIGNEAVHPGQLDLRDDIETATSLFGLINFIADHLITNPKQIKEIYGKIPSDKKEGIEKRDTIKA